MPKVKELRFKFSSGYIYATFAAYDGMVSVSIGEPISKHDWDNGIVRKGTTNLMNTLKTRIDKLAESKHNAVEKVYRAEVVEAINHVLGRKPKHNSGTLADDLQKYSDLIASNDITKDDGSVYSKGKIDQLRNVIYSLNEYKMGDIKTASFGLADRAKFIKKLLADEYAQNTIASYNANLMRFFKDVKGLGWITEDWWTGNKTAISPEEVSGNVFFSEAELDKFYNTPIKSDNERLTRDLFVFGCCIALRHSDLARLSEGVYVDGILHKLNKKTGVTTLVPIKKLARDIWDKYDRNFPPIDDNTFFLNIQRIAKRAGFDTPCHYVSMIGGKMKEQVYPKWEMIGTHTMRRSFATNAFLSGMSPFDIMKFTGHTKIETLMKYICVTPKEAAERLKGHAFFQ